MTLQEAERILRSPTSYSWARRNEAQQTVDTQGAPAPNPPYQPPTGTDNMHQASGYAGSPIPQPLPAPPPTLPYQPPTGADNQQQVAPAMPPARPEYPYPTVDTRPASSGSVSLAGSGSRDGTTSGRTGSAPATPTITRSTHTPRTDTSGVRDQPDIPHPPADFSKPPDYPIVDNRAAPPPVPRAPATYADLPPSGSGTVPSYDPWQRPPLPDYNGYPLTSGQGTARQMLSNSQLGFQTDEPLQMAEQNRLAARNWWEASNQDAVNAQNRYQDYENYFRDRSLEGGWAGGYGDILSGRGGYSPQEQNDIIQGNLLMSGVAGQDQLDSVQLSPQEQAAIAGSPFAARDLAAGQMQYLGDLSHEGEKRQREASDYMGRLYGDATEGMAGQLGVSEGYLPGIGQTIANTATGYNEINDPRWLGVSDEFWGRYDVTPRDMQDIRDSAARRIALNTQASNEALERRAAAQGNSSPLAIAAAQNRANLYGDINASDAALRADIQAKQLGLNTTQQRENQRLSSERDIADRGTGALQHLSGMSYDTQRDYEDMRLGAARDVSNRMMQRASDEGHIRTAQEADIANKAVDLGKYQTGTMIGLTDQGEQESARRAADLAENRQSMGQYGIGTAFAQRAPAAGQLSQSYQSVYDQRKGEEQEGRGFLTGQQGSAQEGAIATRQQNIGAAGTGMGAIGDATAAAIEAKYIPGFMEKLGAVIGG